MRSKDERDAVTHALASRFFSQPQRRRFHLSTFAFFYSYFLGNKVSEQMTDERIGLRPLRVVRINVTTLRLAFHFSEGIKGN